MERLRGAKLAPVGIDVDLAHGMIASERTGRKCPARQRLLYEVRVMCGFCFSFEDSRSSRTTSAVSADK